MSRSKKPRLETLAQTLPKQPKAKQALSSKFAEARAQLHLSAHPKRLVCREKEQTVLRSFILDAVKSGEGSTLCTGKTATVTRVVHELQKEMEFKFLELNGMNLRKPEEAYIVLLKLLCKEKASATRAAEQLEEMFSGTRAGRKGKTVVLLVDELDQLITKNEKVLYNFFEWPARKGSRLVVIGIANTMDLPERLSSRIGSRMGNRRLIFPAYTSVQMEIIVKDRVASLDVFAPDSIDICTKRLAASSGDLRGALAICSRATSIAESANAPQVTDEHVAAAVQELLSPARLLLLKTLSMHERVMIAVLIKMQRMGPPPLLIELIEPHQTAVSNFFCAPAPSVAAISMTLARLRACQLVDTDDPQADLHQRVKLRISEAEVRVAYTDASCPDSNLLAQVMD